MNKRLLAIGLACFLFAMAFPPIFGWAASKDLQVAHQEQIAACGKSFGYFANGMLIQLPAVLQPKG